MRPLAPFMLALLLAVPCAAAHVGDFTGVYAAEADGLAVVLVTESTVVKAQREMVFNGTVYSNTSGERKPIPNASVRLEVTGPGTAVVETARRDEGFQVRIDFPAPGEWLILVHVGRELRTISMHVYPPTSVWMESSNLRTNYHYAQKHVRETLYFLDDATGLVVNATRPATGRLARYVNDTPIDAQDITLQPGPMGSVIFEQTFPEEGWSILTVASPQHGIAHESLPAIVFHVLPPLAAAPAKTPGPGALGLIAIAAALALAQRK